MNWPVVGATVFRFAEIAPLTAEIYLSANPRFQSRYSSSEISPESRLARIAAHALTAASSFWAPGAAGSTATRAPPESESPPFPLTHRVPFGHDAVNGERGHGTGHPSPRYSAGFKQQAVRLHGERGGTYAETAREPGVDPGSPSDWARRADAAQAPAGGGNPFQMAEDLRRLRRENERLKRESEILLKASAFLAGRQP